MGLSVCAGVWVWTCLSVQVCGFVGVSVGVWGGRVYVCRCVDCGCGRVCVGVGVSVCASVCLSV